MTFQECIAYLYNRLPMFSRVGDAAYKKDLGNIRLLLEHIGNPHEHFRSIHIAGTNGKGSVSHMMAAVLQTAGYNTGLYTSPHLRDFRERIKVNGDMVTKAFVVDFTQQIQPAIESIEPSFFEVTVAMAIAWFAVQQVDIAVVETGLGGRLDSTNIIQPVCSIITNIGWDHMNLLGDTLEKIAGEKAGIIKPGVPVVVGERQLETTQVFESKAQQESAPLVFAEDVLKITHVLPGVDRLEIIFRHDHGGTLSLRSGLPGIYQQYNVRTVLAAIEILRHNGWVLTEDHIRKGIAQAAAITGLGGRWQVLHRRPWVIADVAHNVDGIRQLMQHTRLIAGGLNAIHIIYATSADKDTAAIFALLPRQYRYYFTNAQLPRAMPAAQLAEKAQVVGISGPAFGHIHEALRHVATVVDRNDLVVVCGSVFMVGEIDEAAITTLFPPSA